MLVEGIIKGLAETARNFFGSFFYKERLTTVQFPEERLVLPEAARVFPLLVYDGEDSERACAASLAKSARRNAPRSASTSKKAKIRSRISWASSSSIPRSSILTFPCA